MARNQMVRHKAERDYKKAQAQETQAKSNFVMASAISFALLVVVIVFVCGLVWLVWGKLVMTVVTIIFSLIVFAGFVAYWNDRSQERSLRITMGAYTAFGGGLSENLKQQARTSGLADQERIRLASHYQKQLNQVEAYQLKHNYDDAEYDEDDIVDVPLLELR